MTARKLYAELDTITNFSFLRGASHPEELVERAAEINLHAIGIADDNSLAGVVRAHVSAKDKNVKLLVGARLIFADRTPTLLVYPLNLRGYESLSHLLTTGKIRAKKGCCELYFEDLALLSDVIVIAIPPDDIDHDALCTLKQLHTTFSKNFYCAARFIFDGFSDETIAQLIYLEEHHGIPIVATNAVLAHDETRRPLADIVACIKASTTLLHAGALLRKNSERYLKPPEEMWRLFCKRTSWLTRTITISDRITFSLDQLRYYYPSSMHPSLGDEEYLVQATYAGAKIRYGDDVPQKILELLEKELHLVNELGYATYFLTVYDIVMYARTRNILCQGRGSAANSAICYCLGITEVDPNVHDLLFGRFISKERNEPPDIDVDFENAAREEVMQYIFDKYGRDHAAITATVITYRKRMAVREIAKVFGLPVDAVDSLMRAVRGIALSDIVESINSDEPSPLIASIARDAGLCDRAPILATIFTMAHLMLRFPRHLGQHVGGFVINQQPLHNLVPISNAAMVGRTFIEWDKDDLDALGILKVDILALGMLSAIKRCFQLIERHFGVKLTLANIAQEDQAVYRMLSRADSVGVFQVESRAQMSMLPRLKPKTFYDLVVQVAIIRPGPIQGDMVHPYLRRRNGLEPVTFPSQALKKILVKTLGIPLFQEQVMHVAIVAAGFSPGEADGLRRSMATFKRLGKVGHYYDRFINGMLNNGYAQDFAERVFNQMLGFAEYGFPQSHAASFANLVYVSAWLKYYYPEAFTCALLNSQPMGFYGPSQLISDAKRHNVTVMPIDVNHSQKEHSLERLSDATFALRLGFQSIKGLYDEDIDWLIACRPKQGYTSINDIHRRTSITKKTLLRLNQGQAFHRFGLDERQAQWQIMALVDDTPPLLARIVDDDAIAIHFKQIGDFDRVRRDYRITGFSLGKHPMSFVRDNLRRHGYSSHADIAQLSHHSAIKVAGLIIIRQRPATAKGVIFFTLEDEFGLMNIVIWPALSATRRKEVLLSTAVAICGRLEKKDGVHHIIADDIRDLSHLFIRLNTKSRDFR